MKDIFLKMDKIDKRFGGVHALKNVDLEIQKGEILCLIGENGSGKSTLIKVISGMHRPDSGTLVVEGKTYDHLTAIQSIRSGIQVIYQDFSLFPNLTIAENISSNYFLSAKKKIVSRPEMKAVARKALAQIEMEMPLDKLVEELSVAEKQLVAIARAMLYDAKLIIMDEPTTALTTKEVEKLFNVIRKLQKKGCAILFVSHKLDEIQQISERIVVLRNGEKVADDRAENYDKDKMTYYISGKKIGVASYEYERKENDVPVMRVKNLCCQNFFKEIDFELYRGEILGITGLLGSGRTELALSLFGALAIDCGSIERDGKKIEIKNVGDAIAGSIGYVPEDRITEGLFLEESIEQNILVRLVNESKKQILHKEELHVKAEELVRKLTIKMNSLEDPVKSLSGGNQQRVVLAKWLSICPEILILNGPSVGVDIGSKREIHDILRKLAKEGMSLIVISDDISEIMQVCNRVCVMNLGRFICQKDVKEITEKQIYSLLTG